MGTLEWWPRRPGRTFESVFRSRARGAYAKRLVLATVAACLSACSSTTLSESDSKARTSSNLAELVRFGTWVQTLDDAKLDEQYERMLMQYRASPSNGMAIKLSLVLSRPGAHASALAEALALLTEAQSGQEGDTDLGRIVHQFISERHLAATANASLLASLAEERQRSARLDAELAAARATLERAERERAALVQQLDALKAIESRIALDGAPTAQ